MQSERETFVWVRALELLSGYANSSCADACEKSSPPEKETRGKTGFQSAGSGGGEQSLLDREARTPIEGASFRRHQKCTSKGI